jgi:hypothetical protein
MALILDREVLDAPAVAVVDADVKAANSDCATVDPPKHLEVTPATVMQLTADAGSRRHSCSPTRPLDPERFGLNFLRTSGSDFGEGSSVIW